MFCKDKVQLNFSIDYVCALAETLLCFQCKKITQQPHICINSHCSKVFCYLCVHKFDKCPNCRVKYSDKSYLEYYESEEEHLEFMFSMISRLQKENVKLPLIIRKVVAQSNSVGSKRKIQVGNSSKQTEFPDDDDYLMQIENNPNIINNVAVNQMKSDSDDDECLRNGDATSDPAWTPGDSPISLTKKPLREDHKKGGIGKTKTTRELKELERNRTNEIGGASIQSDSLKINNLSALKKDSERIISDILQTKEIEDIEGKETRSLGCKKNSKMPFAERLRETLEGNNLEEKSTSHKEADNATSGFDRLLNECAKEKAKCLLTETNGSSKNNRSDCNNRKKGNELHNTQENFEKILNQEDEKEALGGKKQYRMSPNEARLKQLTSKTYEKKNQSSATGFLNHRKSAATLFQLEEEDKEEMEKDNDFDEVSKKNSADSILNKYFVYDLIKEGDSPIQTYKSSLKRKIKDPGVKNDSEEFNELFNTKKEIKSSTREKNNTMEKAETFGNLDGSNSKDSTMANVNQEQTHKKTRKQLNLNKNTSEIENLIQSKRIKIDNIEIEELSSNDLESNQKQDNVESIKEIDLLLSSDKEINIVTKNTRQRKNSKCDSEPEKSNSIKNEPRQTRRKKISESSADISVFENNKEKSETIKNKRTRSTPRIAISKNAELTDIENKNEKAETIKSESTPKPNSRKRPLKSATSSTKNTKIIELDAVQETIKDKTNQIDSEDDFFSQSTPKIRSRKRVPKAGILSDASSESASSKSTSEYLTPMSETPRSKTESSVVGVGKELSTPKTSHGKKGSAFKEPEKLNMTPVVKTPSTAKKFTAMNPMYKRNMKGETPLHTACKKDPHKVLSLLKNNMTPNVKDNAGWTPLHDAVSLGKETVVRLLLEAGALVNAPGLDNDTPLHLAARNERLDLAQLLIQYGADIGLRNINGYKPLEYFDFIHRPDLKSSALAALQRPRLIAPAAPLPPSPSDVVLFLDQLDKAQTSLVARFSRVLASEDRGILVSPLLQSNVNILLVSGRENRLCAPSTNVLKAILSGIKAVDIAWISRCLELNQIVPTEEYEILATTEYPDARPFKRSAENSEKLGPALFNGLQVYLARPWPTSCVLPCEDAKDLIKRGGACLLNREPDPESMHEGECTPRVMYHVTEPDHPLYRLSQGILYDEKAPPRRLYNMSHVKGLSVEWLRTCVQTFSIVAPINPFLET